MAALISILLEMPKGEAMSSSGFSIRTTWATRICKEKNFISRIQVQPHGTRTNTHHSTIAQRASVRWRAWCHPHTPVYHQRRWCQLDRQIRLPPELLTTLRIPPPAHRRERGRPWRMDTNFWCMTSEPETSWPVEKLFTYRTGIFRTFVEIFCVINIEFLAIVRYCLHDHTFSRFATTPTCDGRTRHESKYRDSVASHR